MTVHFSNQEEQWRKIWKNEKIGIEIWINRKNEEIGKYVPPKGKNNKLTEIITEDTQPLCLHFNDFKSSLQRDTGILTPTKIDQYFSITSREELWNFLSKWWIKVLKFCVILA
jgi:hypothetical protein